jgi:predicted nucleic acid-binding protein
MKDKIFVDTNILLYLLSDDARKKNISKNIIRQTPSISIQVLNEVANVAFRKLSLSAEKTLRIINFLSVKCSVMPVEILTIKTALKLKEKYQYSYYDCLILAAALGGGCNILYSENFHNSHNIEGKIKIINPFK